MKMMDCPLYEVAMKVESYTGSANGRGSANVTKNLLKLGGSTAVTPRTNNALHSLKGKTLSVTPIDGSHLQVRVVDVNGKVKADFHTASATAFSLSDIPAGLYFIDINGAGVQQSSPIVLE